MTERRPDQSSVGGPALSVRESEVLRLAAHGLTYADIGKELGVALPTVRNHIVNAYRKLGALCLVDALRAVGWLRVP